MDDGKTGYDPSPVNPLPPVVIVIFVAIFGVETAFLLGNQGLIGGPDAVGWRLALTRDYGLSPDILKLMWETGRMPPEHLLRLISYPFIHLDFTHMAIASVIFLAMGKMVGEVIGQLAVVVLFFGGAVAGALAYGLLLNEQIWLIGAYPGSYALIGGFTFILWTKARLTGGNQVRAFSLIAFLMVIQIVFGLLFGTHNQWFADLCGFVAGFLLCFPLTPGSLQALLALLRQR